ATSPAPRRKGCRTLPRSRARARPSRTFARSQREANRRAARGIRREECRMAATATRASTRRCGWRIPTRQASRQAPTSQRGGAASREASGFCCDARLALGPIMDEQTEQPMAVGEKALVFAGRELIAWARQRYVDRLDDGGRSPAQDHHAIAEIDRFFE